MQLGENLGIVKNRNLGKFSLLKWELDSYMGNLLCNFLKIFNDFFRDFAENGSTNKALNFDIDGAFCAKGSSLGILGSRNQGDIRV